MHTPAIGAILFVLADGPSHGYRIMQEVEAMTAGGVRLGPGTLYRSLQRMRVGGLIEEIEGVETPGDERRRSYRLTELGWTTAEAEASRLAALLEVAASHGLLSPRGVRAGWDSTGAPAGARQK